MSGSECSSATTPLKPSRRTRLQKLPDSGRALPTYRSLGSFSIITILYEIRVGAEAILLVSLWGVVLREWWGAQLAHQAPGRAMGSALLMLSITWAAYGIP